MCFIKNKYFYFLESTIDNIYKFYKYGTNINIIISDYNMIPFQFDTTLLKIILSFISRDNSGSLGYLQLNIYWYEINVLSTNNSLINSSIKKEEIFLSCNSNPLGVSYFYLSCQLKDSTNLICFYNDYLEWKQNSKLKIISSVFSINSNFTKTKSVNSTSMDSLSDVKSSKSKDNKKFFVVI